MGLERSKESPESNEGVSRRGALQFLGKVAAGIAAVKVAGLGSISEAEARDMPKSYEEEVDVMIGNLAKIFGKNGPETVKCKTGEGLTTDQFNRYLNWMSLVGGALENAYNDPRKSSILEKYLKRDDPPTLLKYGLDAAAKKQVLDHSRPGAKPPEVLLNSYVVSRNGKFYEVTAKHGTGGEKSFFSIEMGPDVAVREITKGYHGQAIELDQSIDDEDLSGKIGVIIGSDVHGNLQKIHTPFIRMTPEMIRKIYPNYDRDVKTDQNLAALEHSYMCVLPAQYGLRNEYNQLGFKGISGSFSGVKRGANDVATTGPVMSAREISSSCTEVKGLCNAIGFVATRKAVTDVIDAYERRNKIG